MHSLRKASIAVAAAALLAPAPAAADDPPPTLTGQVVVADVSNCNTTFNPGFVPPPGDPCIDPSPEQVDAQCNPQGRSHLSWDVEGQASYPTFVSPYPGAFAERGSATIGAQDDPPVPLGPGPLGVLDGTNYVAAGPLETFGATFEIDSPTTGATITGVKDLVESPVGNYGACLRVDNAAVPAFPPGNPGTLAVDGYFKIANADVARYTALIRTPNGVYADRGRTRADVREVFASYVGDGQRQLAADVGVVAQTFISDLSETELVAPSDKEQCKDDKWQLYTQPAFKNQGDCVSFVATGGHNPPAG